MLPKHPSEAGKQPLGSIFGCVLVTVGPGRGGELALVGRCRTAALTQQTR